MFMETIKTNPNRHISIFLKLAPTRLQLDFMVQ